MLLSLRYLNSIFIICTLIAFSGCNKNEAVKVNIGEYVSPQSVWSWLQQGSVFCYNPSHDGSSCTLVEYPDHAGKNQAAILQVFLSGEDNKIKMHKTQKLQLTKDGICVTSSLEEFDSMVFYEVGSLQANITNEDTLIPVEKQKNAIEGLKRISAPAIGTTTCYKHLVTKLTSEGTISEIQEHAFVDGIRQTRERDSVVTFFSIKDAKDNLALRPNVYNQAEQQRNISENNDAILTDETMTSNESKVDANSESIEMQDNEARLYPTESLEVSVPSKTISATLSCDPTISTYTRIGDSIVICGCDYDSYARSSDGSSVCAGGLFDSYARNSDGSEVVCGGRYDSYSRSSDGSKVCAGGLYDSYARNSDGSEVACGGRYDSYARSSDGKVTCYGGLYQR